MSTWIHTESIVENVNLESSTAEIKLLSSTRGIELHYLKSANIQLLLVQSNTLAALT